MKVTVCFDDTKVIVPCGAEANVKLRVADVIENSIAKYKKAAVKVNTCFGLFFVVFSSKLIYLLRG